MYTKQQLLINKGSRDCEFSSSRKKLNWSNVHFQQNQAHESWQVLPILDSPKKNDIIIMMHG
jgi:hypothetical protein